MSIKAADWCEQVKFLVHLKYFLKQHMKIKQLESSQFDHGIGISSEK